MTCETCENCIHKRVCVYVEMAGSPEDLPDEASECVHFHPTEKPQKGKETENGTDA